MSIFQMFTDRSQSQTWTEFHQRYGTGDNPYDETPAGGPSRQPRNLFTLLLKCCKRPPKMNPEDPLARSIHSNSPYATASRRTSLV